MSDLSIFFVDLLTSEVLNKADSLIRMTTNGGAEGHRSVLSRVLVEVIGTKTAIELTDARSDVIAYGNMGKLVGVSESAIEVTGAASRDLVVHGMNFHNVSAAAHDPTFPDNPPPNYMLDLKSLRNATISGNVFAPFQLEQNFLRVAPDQCSGIVVGNAMARRLK